MSHPVILQAIVTEYRGPTNTRGARVQARCNGGVASLAWDHEVNAEEMHRIAAEMLAVKMNWFHDYDLTQGAMPGDRGYCFTLSPKAAP